MESCINEETSHQNGCYTRTGFVAIAAFSLDHLSSSAVLQMALIP